MPVQKTKRGARSLPEAIEHLAPSSQPLVSGAGREFLLVDHDAAAAKILFAGSTYAIRAGIIVLAIPRVSTQLVWAYCFTTSFNDLNS
jgi:hypothetical protein